MTRLGELAAALLLGALTALVWVNLNAASYAAVLDAPWFALDTTTVSLRWFTNFVLIALFWGYVAKKATESFFPGGPLSSLRRAATPAFAAIGGVLAPVAVFFALHTFLTPRDAFSSAWAVPAATDLVLCGFVASRIFGRDHPAVAWLLAVAVLDNVVALAILATFYTAHLHPMMLGLAVLGMAVCEGMRRFGVTSVWGYLLIGAPLCWFGLYSAGVHPALAVALIVPYMPHAGSPTTHDTMSNFDRAMRPAILAAVLLFGFANGGVSLAATTFSAATLVVATSLLLGKIVGITLGVVLARKAGFELPEQLSLRDVLVAAILAGIGFTGALLLLSASAIEQPASLTLGVLLSLVAAPLALLVRRATR